MIDNNVKLVGVIDSPFIFSNTVYDEDFYTFDLSCERASGNIDKLQVMISAKLIDASIDMTGICVEINGSFRSHNARTENGQKSSLILYVFVDEIHETVNQNINTVWLEGYLCKDPSYRKTPMGREISDLLVAVNRYCGKSDYLPVIAWGRNARYTSEWKVGTKVCVYGRIQSREYTKLIGDEKVPRTAYEVSASRIDVCPEAGGDSIASENSSGKSDILQ